MAMGTDAFDLQEVEGSSGTPGGGRYVLIRLAVRGDTIIEASYRCNGCAYAHQLARGLTTFLKGRTLNQAALLEAHDILAIAGPVPDGKDYYAGMIVEALTSALANFTLCLADKTSAFVTSPCP